MDKVLFILIGSLVMGAFILFSVPSSRVGIGALMAWLEEVGVKRK